MKVKLENLVDLDQKKNKIVVLLKIICVNLFDAV